MRIRASVVGVVAVAAVGAGDAPRSVSVEDPCGDFVTVAPQPEDWARNDLAALTLEEVRDSDGVVLGVDVHVETCGDAAAPSRVGEYLEVRWSLGEDCWASVADGSAQNATHVSGNTGIVLGPSSPRLAVRCHEALAPYGLVATTTDRTVVALPDGAVSRVGTRTTFALRVADLGELASLVDAGVTIDGASAASAATYGTTVVHGSSTYGSLQAGVVDWTPSTDALTLGD